MKEWDVTEVRQRLMGLAARAVEATRMAASRESDRSDAGAPDGRDATITRLEQEIAVERAKSEALLGTLKELEFKLGVLEKSYSKQLADAKTRGEAAMQELASLKAQLAETTDELRRTREARDRLREMLAFDGRRIPPELRERQAGGDDTIARLLAIDSAAADKPANRGERPDEPPRQESEPEPADLIAPDLVFNKDDDEKDG
jgi:chromosome segregation ATPase